jgi:phage tail-like protein
MNDKTGFFYLNSENRWPYFQDNNNKKNGLAIDEDGALTLERVPGAETPVSLALDAPAGAAGIAVDDDGYLYLSAPAENRVLKLDPCAQDLKPALHLGEESSLPGQFRKPRGIVVGPPEALYVADSGNHRIQVFDRHTLQLRGVWGQPDPYAEPRSGGADGRFKDPWDLAMDRTCYFYVVDHGNHRVQKLDVTGQVVPEFRSRMSATATLDEPTHVAIERVKTGREQEEERLHVVDRGRHEVLVFDTAGEFLRAWGAEVLRDPSGITFVGQAIYVGDNQRKRVLKFRAADGSFVGEARGYEGPIAGLGVDQNGHLLVHPGRAKRVVRLVPDAAFVPQGSFWGGPFEADGRPVQWHRMRVDAAPLSEGAHLRLFTCTSDGPADPPVDPQAENPFADPAWQRLPHDVLDALILRQPAAPPTSTSAPIPAPTPTPPPVPANAGWDAPSGQTLSPPARYLWIGGLLQSDGSGSPTLRQIRVDYGRDTYLRHLPAIYAEKAASRDLLERFLSLFESVLGGLEDTIETSLPQLFDPGATPARFLPWLAGWLAFDLDEDWSDEQQRQRIAEAFSLQSKRGTVEGLRRYLKLYAGVEARIEEPSLQTSLWSLGEVSTLGLNTMLAPAHAQGAVLGTTATLGQSHLIGAEDYGAPLFEDLAFRFCVQIHRSELTRPGALDEVRAVIEREKPAHTDYHLCVIEPRMRVGFQARVGVDTIVGGRPPDLVLDRPLKLGFETVVSETPGQRKVGSRIGQDSRVGLKTALI